MYNAAIILIVQKITFPANQIKPKQPKIPFVTSGGKLDAIDGMLIAKATTTKKQNGLVHN
jgi:hypothetical protein